MIPAPGPNVPGGTTATMDVTYTQANAAGGAVVCEITPGTGQEFILIGARIVNSGTNGIGVNIETAAAGTGVIVIAAIGSGAGTKCNLNVGSVSTSGPATSDSPSGVGYPTIVSGTQTLKIFQSGAGAQNDTFRVLINIRITRGGLPTVIHSNSTNAANVSATAGAESFAYVP